MSDTFITMVLVVAVALVMFIFPIYFIANQNEVISNTDIQILANNFVNTVAKEGKITRK